MNLAELLRPWTTIPLPELALSGLQNDSRQLKVGELFFAYPGAAADGRLYMEKAALAGASAIVYEPQQLSCALPEGIPCVPIAGLANQLAAIAHRYYGEPSQHLAVTGVTGTNGKTTIAYQLAQAYGLLNQRAAYIGTLGQGDVRVLKPLVNTTPDALCLQHCLYEYQQRGIQRVCMEVSSHALSQGRVDAIAFQEAIYTNLSLDHLDYHKTMQAYAEAKASLFAKSSLKWAIINQDDAYSDMMTQALPASCQRLSYGIEQGDVRAVRWQSSLSGSQIEVVSPWGSYELWVKLLGKFNVYNSLAVFASLLMNDIAPTDIVHLMEKLHASPGRMEQVAQKPCVIVDYAHTPDALENVLLTLVQLKQGRVLVVFGCGGDRDKSKRPLMGRIASQHADLVIVTSDNPRSEDPLQIIEEIAAGLLPNKPVLKIPDRKEAIHQALASLNENDVLLIAGKGHENYQLIAGQSYPFSDQAVVREYFQ
jgi:UDP-N-acetylmuramoyl-L-alanyl-D-glutamate--2,6-diaminopimelate ligase